MKEQENIEEVVAGLNADLDQTKEILAEGRINYKSGNSIVYERNDSPYRGFDFTYNYGGKTLRLNDLVNEGWRIIPVRSSFRVTVADRHGLRNHPEIELSIPRLEEDENSILSALHEIGHSRIFQFFADNYPGERNVRFNERVQQADRYFREKLTGQCHTRLHERHAWAYAIRTARKLGMLEWLSNSEIREYYRPKLATYGDEALRPGKTAVPEEKRYALRLQVI